LTTSPLEADNAAVTTDEGRADRVQLERLLSTWPIAAAFLTGTIYYTLTKAHASYLNEFGLGASTFSHSIFELAARDLFTLLLVIFFLVVALVLNRLIVGEWLYRKIDGAADWTTNWLTATANRRRVSLPIALALMPVLTLGVVVAISDFTGRARAESLKSEYANSCRHCWVYTDKLGKKLLTGAPIDQDANRIAVLTATGASFLKLDDVGFVKRVPAHPDNKKPVPTASPSMTRVDPQKPPSVTAPKGASLEPKKTP